MKLNLQSLAKCAGVYGAPLYAKTVSHGIVAPGEYEFNAQYGYLIIPIDETQKINVFVKASRLEEGVNPETDSFEIADFVAQRDSDGVSSNGTAWTVVAGAIKTLAI